MVQAEHPVLKCQGVQLLRPWNFKIAVRHRGRIAVYLQIAHALIEEIRRGRLAPGSALPGTRELAESLGVNRKTVVDAYDELAAQGWVKADRTRGTFVSSELPVLKESHRAPRRPLPAPMPDRPDFRMVGTVANIPPFLPEKDHLLFDDGAPDTRHVPVAALGRAYRAMLTQAAQHNRLGYGDPRGTRTLREAVSTMLNVDRGLTTTADNICLTRGSQMAIYLATRLLAGPRDAVVMEELCYPPAREAFRAAGAEVLSVGVDESGMRIDQLEATCRKRRVRVVYVTPHHHFPTTVLLKPDRRLRLLALAEQFGFAIIEDDYDHEFHFVHQPMLPLASVDPWGKVVYIGSMSKLLAPSLRLGYIAAPKAFVDRAAAEIMMIDRQGDPAMELAIAELIADGEIHRHTRRAMRLYAERRLLMAQLLSERFRDRVRFTLPDGGLAIWVNFTDAIDVDALARAARAKGVKIMPGSAFTTSGRSIGATRLGFASMNAAELDRATRRLRLALGAMA
ncbi:MAG TPA: PLP-dependent aminotransferase family protein [Stellaceae bacterium]|nr:PLP-dependent aminotransferase family protein [Stellaceae bacterium]